MSNTATEVVATTAYGGNEKKRKVGEIEPVEVVGPYGLITSTAHGCAPDVLRQARVDLAACYRILDRMNLNEGIDNHLTVMVPGTQPLRFLCIAYGLAWSEVTASNLLLLDETGKVLEGSGAPDPTAFFIHSRIHKKHPHAVCVLHTHMPHATALCCLEDMELKMINQNCLRFYDEVAYDTDYKGLVLGTVEGDRMAQAMGSNRVLMHRNHGVITCGDSVAEAFDELYYLERCAQVQCLAYATNRPLATVSDEICVEYKKDVVKFRGCWAEKHFAARSGHSRAAPRGITECFPSRGLTHTQLRRIVRGDRRVDRWRGGPARRRIVHEAPVRSRRARGGTRGLLGRHDAHQELELVLRSAAHPFAVGDERRNT